MDLVEIRKKAKARKEAEAAKARSGPGAEGPAKHEEPDNKDGQAGVSVPAEAAPPAAVEQPALEAHEAPVDGAEYLAFMLSDEEYALRIDDVREIIRPRAITAVPRAPGFVMGVISLRGAVMPVFDIKKRLGLGEAEVSPVVAVAEQDRDRVSARIRNDDVDVAVGIEFAHRDSLGHRTHPGRRRKIECCLLGERIERKPAQREDGTQSEWPR